MGSFISDTIKSRNIPIEQLERQTGVSKTIIYSIIAGRGYSIDSLLAILAELRCHIDITALTDNEAIPNTWTATETQN